MKACGVYALLPTIGDHLICRQHGTFAERLGETCVRQVTQGFSRYLIEETEGKNNTKTKRYVH